MKRFTGIKNYSLLSLLLLLASCGGSTESTPQKMTPQQIEKRVASGVVLIKNTYYYTISFNGGNAIYFTGIDEDGDPVGLTFDPSELSPSTAFGTGFIIAKNGLIATNSHVASPSVDISSVRSSLVNAFRSWANEFSKEVNNMNQRLNLLQLAIIAADNSAESFSYRQQYNQLTAERDETQEVINALLSISGMDFQATVHTNIGIAYNDTHVSNMSDFYGCVTVADDPAHDLAILQLKDKTTPEGKFVFRLPGSTEGTTARKANTSPNISVGTKLYMIGFNLGPTLGLTKEGIKAQTTSGEVSQDTDDTRIMYTIPTLHGSSGSPVIDEYGRLVAINYAGIDITQNFNYGIKVNFLKKLLDEFKRE